MANSWPRLEDTVVALLKFNRTHPEMGFNAYSFQGQIVQTVFQPFPWAQFWADV